MSSTAKTTKGRPCKIVDGFTLLFHRDSASGLKHYWRCSKYASGCLARGTSAGDGPVAMTSKHNHIADPASPEKRIRRAQLKEAASANRATPSMSLAAGAQEGVEAAVLQQLPSQRAFQQVVNRARKIDGAAAADLPPERLILPDQMKQTLRNRRFLLADTFDSDPGKPRILVFVSEYGIDLLKDNRDWCIDGTFHASPKFFDNLLTVNAFVGKASLPAAYILMPGRSEEDYDRAFAALFQSEQLSGVTPTSVVTDMEKALTNALEKLFDDAELHLCLFHLAQAVFTQVQKRGLLPVYSVQSARELIRCLVALACLPPEEVVRGYKDVVTAMDKMFDDNIVDIRYKRTVKEFTDYFASTYIGVKRNGILRRPRFDIRSWSCFQRTLDDMARTNNAIEGWHAALNALFSRSGMVMSQFIARIQKEEEKTFNLGVRHAMNPAEHLRGRKSTNNLREANLRALVQQYDSTPTDKRNRLDFLLNVQFHLSQAAFQRVLKEADENDQPTPPSSQGSQAAQTSQAFLEEYVELACESAAPSATAEVRVGPSVPFSAFNFLE